MWQRVAHFVADGLETTIIGKRCRTGRQTNDQVHFRLESNGVARLAERGLYREFPALAIDRHIHEAVEGAGDIISHNTVRLKCGGQITEAPPMGLLIPIDNSKRIFAAWSEKEVVSSDRVLHDGQHWPRSIRPQFMTFRQINSVGIIEGPAVADNLLSIAFAESEKVCHLLSHGVEDLQKLTFPYREGFSATRGDCFLGSI